VLWQSRDAWQLMMRVEAEEGCLFVFETGL
jgi:hypothetical protein